MAMAYGGLAPAGRADRPVSRRAVPGGRAHQRGHAHLQQGRRHSGPQPGGRPPRWTWCRRPCTRGWARDPDPGAEPPGRSDPQRHRASSAPSRSGPRRHAQALREPPPDAETALRQAIDALPQYRAGLRRALRGVSVPGQALPRAALDALVTFQQDPVRAESCPEAGHRAGHHALTWECHELHDQLAASIEANHELTDEQRRLLEKRLEALQRDLSQVTAKKEVLERHLQPALEALLTSTRAVQDRPQPASGCRRPHAGPACRIARQQPAGYGQ